MILCVSSGGWIIRSTKAHVDVCSLFENNNMYVATEDAFKHNTADVVSFLHACAGSFHKDAHFLNLNLSRVAKRQI
jgi:hypothetical protein